VWYNAVVRLHNEWRDDQMGKRTLAVVVCALIVLSGCSTDTPIPTPTHLPVSTWIREKDGAVMVYVPAGEFWMGSDDGDPVAFNDEKPRHKVYVNAFWIDQTEVTNAQYKKCVDASACSLPEKFRSDLRDTNYGNPEFSDCPVVYVTWHQARQYAEWVGGRLPTEAEWEYAARGSSGYIYPWDNDPPNDSLLNYDDSIAGTTPVGSYPDGASWCGALDMAGNVLEWTSSLNEPYPYDATDGREAPEAKGLRVMRGGAFSFAAKYVRCAFRSVSSPNYRNYFIGFRVVASPD
jgi:formylglycine-generating enzyme required for sulfatase activity